MIKGGNVGRTWDEVRREIKKYEMLNDTLTKRAYDAAGYMIRQSDQDWVDRTIETEQRIYYAKISELESELHYIDPEKYRRMKNLCPHCGGEKDLLNIKCTSCNRQLVSDEEVKRRKQENSQKKAMVNKKYMTLLFIGLIIGLIIGIVIAINNIGMELRIVAPVCALICAIIALGIPEWENSIDFSDLGCSGILLFPLWLLWKIVFAAPFWSIVEWHDKHKKK
jgi:hypothetical protein